MILKTISLLILACVCKSGVSFTTQESDAQLWFDSNFTSEYQLLLNRQTQGEWNYSTDLNSNEKRLIKMKTAEAAAVYLKEVAKVVKSYNYKEFKNETLKRLFVKLSSIGDSALDDKDFVELTNIITSMDTIYSTAKICDQNNECGLSLDPDLYNILSTSRNYVQLETIWLNWRNATGAKMKENYLRYVELSNKAAKANNFKNKGEMWRRDYESDTFPQDVEKLCNQLLDKLYRPLHAYVRGKLMQTYGEQANVKGAIPAHILGNMWAQSWGNIYDLVKPYETSQSFDATPEIKKKSVKELFQIAEDFFTKMGLEKMSDEFWERTIYEKPSDRDIVCHASAWDFYDGNDFRIKMCTNKNMEDFITIHHEMGHIQYFMQYKDQPIPFRNGANPGFHEAVGDVLALSVQTPKHLREINLIPNFTIDQNTDINFLMEMALNKIAFLPFGFLIDAWRWSVFNGTYSYNEWNRKWWELRCRYQGIVPPQKLPDYYFDPGAKYHVPNDVPYIRYFVSFINQFQFHKALCKEAGEIGPDKQIHHCDFYNNKNAGKLLGDMLKKGSSEPWPQAMKAITGTENNDINPLLEYFKPLITFLKEENMRLNNLEGWNCDNIKELVPLPKNSGSDDSASILSFFICQAILLLIAILHLFC